MSRLGCRAVRAVVIGGCLVACDPPPLGAQTGTGVLVGVVGDQTGAYLPHVTLTVQNLETGLVQAALTDDRGYYRMAALPAGVYEIVAALDQFETAIRRGITLSVGQQLEVNLMMRLKGIASEVVVTPDAPLIETVSAAVSGLVDQRQMRDLPLNGRDIFQLVQLQAGVSPTPNAGPSPFQKGGFSKAAVNGQRPTGNNVTIDGVDANEPNYAISPGGAAGLLLGVEAIREFRVYTSTYSAEHGRASGSLIQAVTKSGTNEVHGSLFEFHRNAALDAKNFFDLPDRPIPPYVRNQFGGALGGPIVASETFFFGSYEGFREKLGITATSTVANALAHQGVLPSVANPAACSPANTAGCVSIPVNPGVAPLLARMPLPNGPDFGNGTARITSSETQPTREHYAVARVDHSFPAAHSAFARYIVDDGVADLPYLSTLVPGFPARRENRTHLFTAQAASVIGSKLLNQFAFGWNRNRMLASVGATPGLSISLVPNRPLGTIAIASLGNIGNNVVFPFGSFSNTFQLQEAVSYVRGGHALKAGAEFRAIHIDGPFDLFVNGQYSFVDLSPFGVPSVSNNPPLESFLRGIPFIYLGSDPALSDSDRRFRQKWFSSYVQDDWRIGSSVAMNLGIRYDFYSNPGEADGRLVNIRNEAADAVPTVGRIFESTPKNMFSPRFGVVWNVGDSRETVLRGGVGLFRDQIWGNIYGNTRSLQPFFKIFFSVLPTFGDPLNALLVAPTANATPTYNPSFPAVVQYNVNMQRQVTRTSIATLAYVGARGYDLLRMVESNPFEAARGRRVNPNFGSLLRYVTDARSSYHALQATWDQRLLGGLRMQANYTFGRSIDEASGANPSDAVNEAGKASSWSDRGLDRGRSSFDIRHVLVVNGLYDLPFGRGRRIGDGATGIRAALIDGWQLAGTATLHSNVPFTPMLGFDNTGTQSFINSDRPDLVGDPYKGRCANGEPVRTVGCWFNPAAFAPPPPGRQGNAKRNSLKGPDFRTVDLALLKSVALGARSTLQLRIEVFNAFNRPNFAVPTNTAGPNGVGGNGDAMFVGRDGSGRGILAGNAARIFSTVGTSRQIQLGAKVIF